MTYAQAVAYFQGNASALARALKVSKRAVYAWRERGRIPELQQRRLEDLSNGALKRS